MDQSCKEGNTLFDRRVVGFSLGPEEAAHAGHATWWQMVTHVHLRDLFLSVHLTFPVNFLQCKASRWCLKKNDNHAHNTYNQYAI